MCLCKRAISETQGKSQLRLERQRVVFCVCLLGFFVRFEDRRLFIFATELNGGVFWRLLARAREERKVSRGGGLFIYI